MAATLNAVAGARCHDERKELWLVERVARRRRAVYRCSASSSRNGSAVYFTSGTGSRLLSTIQTV